MKILTRYVTLRMLSMFIIVMGGLTALYMVVDFFERIDNFFERNIPVFDALPYFLSKLPGVIVQLAPVSAILAATITFGLMHKNREITAIRAAGIGPGVFLKPVFLVASSIAAMIFIFNETLAIPFEHRADQRWQSQIEKSKSVVKWTAQRIWYRGKAAVYQVRFYRPRSRELRDVSLYFSDDAYQLVKRIDAESVIWRNNRWEACNGSVTTFKNGLPRTETFDRRFLKIEELPQTFEAAMAEPTDLSWPQLYRYAENLLQRGIRPTAHLIQLHSRVAVPFSILILALVGTVIPLAKSSANGIAINVAKALVVVLIYFVLWQAGQAFASVDHVPPGLGIWAANLVLLVFGLSRWRSLF